MTNIDQDQRNADWIKTLHWEFPTDPDMFLAVIGGRKNLDHFMTLPAAEAMPIRLATLLDVGVGKLARFAGKGEWVEHLHPRNEDGEFTHKPGGGDSVFTTEDDMRAGHDGSREDPVPCGDDIKRAAVLISDGYNVTLNQPDEVATLLDVIQEMVKEAQDKGEDAPTFNLCNASVPGTNLFCQDEVTRPDGTPIDRVEMPQLSTKTPIPGSLADSLPRDSKGEVNLSKQFAEYLAASGKATHRTTIDASHLRASQAELKGAQVAGMADAIAEGKLSTTDESARIYVTEDNYVIDGHHRWAAAVAEAYRTGETFEIPVTVVPTDIGTALTLANYWTEQAGIPPKKGKRFWIEHYKVLFDLALTEINGMKVFDETLHPRDNQGQFAEANATTGTLEVPSRLEDLSETEQAMWTESMATHGVTVAALRDTIAGRIDQAALDHAAGWYPATKQLGVEISNETGMPQDVVVAAIAACSPQCEWENAKTGEGERRYISSLAKFVTDGKADGLSAEDATKAWKKDYKEHNDVIAVSTGEPAGAAMLNGNAAKAVGLFRGDKSIEEVLTDNKARSFFDNIMNPGGSHEVTVDTRMMKALEATYGVSHTDALKFSGLKRNSGPDSVKGVGYLAIAEAVREVASRYDVPPDVVQAAYWEQVEKDRQITDEAGEDWPTGLAKTPPKPKKP